MKQVAKFANMKLGHASMKRGQSTLTLFQEVIKSRIHLLPLPLAKIIFEHRSARRIVLCEHGVENFTAGVKAPADVIEIAIQNGYCPVVVNGYVPPAHAGMVAKVWQRIKWVVYSSFAAEKFHRGDVVLLPDNPSFFCRRSGLSFAQRLREKGVRFVFIVHDIHGLRMEAGAAREREMAVFLERTKLFDVLIVHNSAMRRWLVEHGVEDCKLVELKMFDYLSAGVACRDSLALQPSNEICFAGNLSIRKSQWLKSIGEITGVCWNMYGPYYEEIVAHQAKVHYEGCFAPEELPVKLKGSYGLVWDGDSIDTCSGKWGAYERYNNPHKLSLYLAAGMPVIVWSEAATADFVRQNNLGICVSSLRELPQALSAVSPAQYERMVASCGDLSRKVRGGHFLSTALKLAERHCENVLEVKA